MGSEAGDVNVMMLGQEKMSFNGCGWLYSYVYILTIWILYHWNAQNVRDLKVQHPVSVFSWSPPLFIMIMINILRLLSIRTDVFIFNNWNIVQLNIIKLIFLFFSFKMGWCNVVVIRSIALFLFMFWSFLIAVIALYVYRNNFWLFWWNNVWE